MKTYSGSLQRRGKRWYLVVHKDGHQRWFALKTDKLPLARLRASRIAPPDPNEERAWLEQLVREGTRARGELARMKALFDLSWTNLPARVCASAGAAASADSQASHVRWLSIVEKVVRKTFGAIGPSELTANQAQTVTDLLLRTYRSALRILTFMRRAWSDLGLDPDVWSVRSLMTLQKSDGEHYRRLSLEEVRTVHAFLQEKNSALSDMVLLGYSTGLRLSDVAEIELSELSLPFLRLVPNKTRHRKPNPLRIPLTEEALSVVKRRQLAAERNGTTFLFDATCRHRPSRRITAAFRRAGVVKQGNGRASFHSLRATFISLMDEAGVPPHLTDAITGHGGGGMHARYTQPSDTALMAAVRRAIPPVRTP